jgi:hypothetical protein
LNITVIKDAPKGSGRGYSPPNPLNTEIKNRDFVDMIISKLLSDFPNSLNQPLKSADN